MVGLALLTTRPFCTTSQWRTGKAGRALVRQLRESILAQTENDTAGSSLESVRRPIGTRLEVLPLLFVAHNRHRRFPPVLLNPQFTWTTRQGLNLLEESSSNNVDAPESVPSAGNASLQ